MRRGIEIREPEHRAVRARSATGFRANGHAGQNPMSNNGPEILCIAILSASLPQCLNGWSINP